MDAIGRQMNAFKAYQNEYLPDRWRFKNRRTGPCTIVAEPGYAFGDMWKTANGASQKTGIPGIINLTIILLRK